VYYSLNENKQVDIREHSFVCALCVCVRVCVCACVRVGGGGEDMHVDTSTANCT
jgi:hypothetical protein